MKFLIKNLFLFVFFVSIGNSNAQDASVVLKLQNIELLQGNILVALTKDSLQFANFTNPTKSGLKKVAVKSSEQTLIFEKLEPGWYAIAVFQDLNGNDSLDTGKFKIPAEPFGFSNNALAKFRPPWFKDARFYINKNEQITKYINLVYRKPKRFKNDNATK